MEISGFNKGTKLSPYEVMVDQTMKAWLKYGNKYAPFSIYMYPVKVQDC